MPVQRTITESYWTVCWKWIVPYPCKKYRTVTKWCYTFQWVKENRWIFFCTLEGCENGIRYSWTAGCFNVFGSVTFNNIELCFGSKRSESGKCG